MPFANHAGVIASPLKDLCNGGLAAVETIEDGHAVEVAVFSGENRGTAGRANGIHGETIHKAHSLFREAVDARCLIDLAAVGADGVRRVIIGHDEENVWR